MNANSSVTASTTNPSWRHAPENNNCTTPSRTSNEVVMNANSSFTATTTTPSWRRAPENNNCTTPYRISAMEQSMVISPSRPSSVRQAIHAASPNGTEPITKRTKRTEVTIVSDLPDSYLTWENYISSQDRYSATYNINLLRHIQVLRNILRSRNMLLPQNGNAITDIREQIELLLANINGCYNGLRHTISSLPAIEGRNVKSANEKLTLYLSSWNPDMSTSVIVFLPKQPTKDYVRWLNVSVEELALKRSRELEEEKVKAKQIELAEVLKNHLGNADMNVYGHLTVNNRQLEPATDMTDHDVAVLSSQVFAILSSTPVAILPLVKSHPSFFKSYLSDLRKVQNSFSLKASLLASVSRTESDASMIGNVSLISQPTNTSTQHNTNVVINATIISFSCYQCSYLSEVKDNFLQHMKEHEPMGRSTTDSFHETNFTMCTPMESQLSCIDGIKLFRQGSQTSPPAILWSKKSRQNKRIYSKMKVLEEIYSDVGHDAYMDKYNNVKLSNFKK
jgi:hypothetical protein